MSDQTEVQQEKTEYPSQLFVSIAGNHPMAEAALGSVLSTFLTDLNINGRRVNSESFDSKFAAETVNGLAANEKNTVNIMVTSLTLQRMQGQYQAWDWPNWGDASQPWTALVDDSLRNLWPTFTSEQRRAIYNSFNALNIQVEGEDEPMSLEHALNIVNSDNTETYIEFRGHHGRDHWDEVVVDGKPDAAELRAVLFVMENAIPDENGNPVLRQTQTPDTAEVAELELGENPAQNGAHAAAELPDGREISDTNAPVDNPASPEHNPEQIDLTDGVPTVKSDAPSLAVNVPKPDPMSIGIGGRFDVAATFETAQTGLSLETMPVSGSVLPYHQNGHLED